MVNQKLVKSLRSFATIAALAVAFVPAGVTLAQPAAVPSASEMWGLIQMQAKQLEAQAREIEALKKGQRALTTSQNRTSEKMEQTRQHVSENKKRVTETAERVVATAEAVEQSQYSSPSAEQGWWNKTSIGGYGELHYEGGDKDEIDFHRFVLFFGHEFSNRLRFFSELELEHALTKDSADGSGPGEVELEQAYIQFDLNQTHRLNAGLQILPIGILNQTHEPPTFYGVERNMIEKNIIPSTWWEAGLGIEGNLGDLGVSYSLMVHSGLEVPLSGGNAFKIRKGRNKVAKAPANEPAFTGQVKYTGIPGIEVAASMNYQVDITQGAGDPISGESVSAFLFSAHVDANIRGFGLRALYAGWKLNGPAPKLIGRDEQRGFYIEPSYRFPIGAGLLGDSAELGVFYRYSDWNNEAGLPESMGGVNRHTFGANYWPHPDVAFKIDWFHEKKNSGGKENRLNIGVGYQF